MKKVFILIAMMAFTAATVNAQSMAELLKKKKADIQALRDFEKDTKPTAVAEARAKELTEQGYMAVGSGKPIAYQLQADYDMAGSVMANANGDVVNQYVQATGTAVGATQDVAYRVASLNAKSAIAGLLATKLASAIQQKKANAQTASEDAVSVDKYAEKLKSIVEASLKDMKAGLNVYRKLQNRNIEAMVTISYDCKPLTQELKKELQEKLEEDVEVLNDAVDNAMANVNKPVEEQK